MPFVTVEWFEGRTSEQKKKVIEGITDVLTGVGVDKDSIWVLIKDYPRTNWGFGGKQASDK